MNKEIKKIKKIKSCHTGWKKKKTPPQQITHLIAHTWLFCVCMKHKNKIHPHSISPSVLSPSLSLSSPHHNPLSNSQCYIIPTSQSLHDWTQYQTLARLHHCHCWPRHHVAVAQQLGEGVGTQVTETEFHGCKESSTLCNCSFTSKFNYLFPSYMATC